MWPFTFKLNCMPNLPWVAFKGPSDYRKSRIAEDLGQNIWDKQVPCPGDQFPEAAQVLDHKGLVLLVYQSLSYTEKKT